MTSPTLLHLRHVWRPDDRAEQQIREVAFDVPSEVGAVEIEMTYAARPGAVLDLGLVGPRGYVGWSGGARSRVVVSQGWATPGYVPQPVEAGTWAVLVGLHRVPADGVEMELTVRVVDGVVVNAHRAAEPGDPPAVEAPNRSGRPSRQGRLPDVDGMRWIAGDFHSHTVHSDGALSVGGLAALAASRGLDFLAVTDHNTTSHHAHLQHAAHAYGIVLVPGQEVTRDVGHANVLGDIGLVDFRSPPETWASQAESRGGVLSVNHPLAADCAWLLPVGGSPARPAVAEVWHSSWAQVPTWGAPLAWWLMTPGTVPIAGSDFHQHGHDGLPGSPTTWVLAEDDDILGAVRAGRTAVSASVDGPLVVRDGDELVAVDAEGLLLTGSGRARRRVLGDRFRLPGWDGPCWLEDEDRVVHALCG
ncbi:phosphoesterase [Terrabacter tumescens]|uniref:Phosphoesterase n=1 Tax=Terrabacter tumescens TaxID=60443 RepID=A0ABQ2HU40_9MICO|nr:CehA/McbA family metallohydrolase [Terrabacter tumescens]GGM88263.1 phosphoesterase [Terrabacter tumescens]